MTAAATHTQKITWTAGEIKGEKAYSLSNGTYLHFPSLSIPGLTTDQEHVFAIDVSQIQILILLASVDMTLETNSGAAPDNTIALKANVPYVWLKDDSYDACKLTVDVTKIYLTNAGADDGTFEALVIYDSTP